MALRDLPVVAIGYRLSRTQWVTALAGSFLILPPWASDDGTGVSTLGKTNLHCFLAFFFSFVFFVLSMYRTVTRGGAITGGFKPCSV